MTVVEFVATMVITGDIQKGKRTNVVTIAITSTFIPFFFKKVVSSSEDRRVSSSSSFVFLSRGVAAELLAPHKHPLLLFPFPFFHPWGGWGGEGRKKKVGFGMAGRGPFQLRGQKRRRNAYVFCLIFAPLTRFIKPIARTGFLINSSFL